MNGVGGGFLEEGCFDFTNGCKVYGSGDSVGTVWSQTTIMILAYTRPNFNRMQHTF